MPFTELVSSQRDPLLGFSLFVAKFDFGLECLHVAKALTWVKHVLKPVLLDRNSLFMLFRLAN